MTRKSHRAKMLDITPKVRKAVYERDSFGGYPCCVICGLGGKHDMAHYKGRGGSGGLGIEQNLVNLCRKCHNEMDQTALRSQHLAMVKNYLESKYDDWNEEDLIYRWGSRYE